MAYCIKTYKERKVKDSEIAKIIGEIGSFLIDIDEKFGNWILQKIWRKIVFYPIRILSAMLLIIILILLILLTFLFLSKLKTYFIKGKKYEECNEDEQFLVLIGEENVKFRKKLEIRLTIKLGLRDFLDDIFTPSYKKYFVSNIKELRKIKLKKIKYVTCR